MNPLQYYMGKLAKTICSSRAMQHCCDMFFELAQHCSNIVALKIVLADRLL